MDNFVLTYQQFMAQNSGKAVDVMISDFKCFVDISPQQVGSQLHHLAQLHHNYCIRSHGCTSRTCMFFVVTQLPPPHLGLHPEANLTVAPPSNYVNHFHWFRAVNEIIRKVNINYNSGKAAFNGKRFCNWSERSFLGKWDPHTQGNPSSVFELAIPKSHWLQERALALHSWCLSKRQEVHE